MKNKNTIDHFTSFSKQYGRVFFISLIIFISFTIGSCSDFDEPGTIYESSVTKTDDPAITGIAPSGRAVGGVREITISGQNLGIKNGSDTDWVYIGGTKAVIKEIIGNQTLIVYRPQLTNSHYDTPINVSVTALKGIDTSSNFKYIVESPGEATGDYGTPTFSSFLIMAVDFDKQENVYIATNRAVWRNDPSGTSLTQMVGNLSPLSAFSTITDVKFGPGQPGSNIYLANGSNTVYRLRVDSVLTGTIRPTAFDTLPAGVSKLDFDENGNMYSAGSNGIFMTKIDGSTSQSLGYEGTASIKGIRIYGGYIYVADSLNVWRSQINPGDGTLSGKEDLVNQGDISALGNCFINSFGLDADANIYLCLRNHPTYSLFFREPGDGSITPYYYDQNILPNTVEQLVWGNGNQLYLISGGLRATPQAYASPRIFRMELDINGAPYNGRKFLE